VEFGWCLVSHRHVHRLRRITCSGDKGAIQCGILSIIHVHIVTSAKPASNGCSRPAFWFMAARCHTQCCPIGPGKRLQAPLQAARALSNALKSLCQRRARLEYAHAHPSTHQTRRHVPYHFCTYYMDLIVLSTIFGAASDIRCLGPYACCLCCTNLARGMEYAVMLTECVAPAQRGTQSMDVLNGLYDL
jgi:hypothetical protein